MLQGDFFFDADAMQQDLNEEEHNNLDAMVGRLQLGVMPSDVVRTNGRTTQNGSQALDDGSDGSAGQ